MNKYSWRSIWYSKIYYYQVIKHESVWKWYDKNAAIGSLVLLIASALSVYLANSIFSAIIVTVLNFTIISPHCFTFTLTVHHRVIVNQVSVTFLPSINAAVISWKIFRTYTPWLSADSISRALTLQRRVGWLIVKNQCRRTISYQIGAFEANISILAHCFPIKTRFHKSIFSEGTLFAKHIRS